MAFIKNIEHEEIVRLADEISANRARSPMVASLPARKLVSPMLDVTREDATPNAS